MDRLGDRRGLLKALDGEQRLLDLDGSSDSINQFTAQAFEMISGSRARIAFDINREPKSIREEYGSGHYANGCLLARRLVERGVRFVQVYYGNGQPWDTHSKHNEKVGNLCRDIDQPTAALLGDLKRRGLLEGRWGSRGQ